MKLNNNDDSHNSGLNLLIYNMLLDIESHPAWVCGLKHSSKQVAAGIGVTPCVGVWIETQLKRTIYGRFDEVTPCVGVWIETFGQLKSFSERMVTPCVGVWIETLLVHEYLLLP